MSNQNLILSDKYKEFIRHEAPVEMLEGVTAAGKTTVGIFKFMLKVAESEKKYHIIAAKYIGTAEKHIINKDLGIIDDFGILTEYNGNGTKDEKIPHILYHTSTGEKSVYVMGYGDKKKWQKALGGQYGCLYIDEINTADIDFVREAVMRADYTMGTLNPDDPSLPAYKDLVATLTSEYGTKKRTQTGKKPGLCLFLQNGRPCPRREAVLAPGIKFPGTHLCVPGERHHHVLDCN